MKNFSIVVPVFNEESILVSQVSRILKGIKKLNLPVNFELILIENGSTDDTCRLTAKISRKYKNVKRVCLPFPSYGQAFKAGLQKAAYPYVFQFDIDFWDANFIKKSQKLLNEYDFVIGSKNLNHSVDKRRFLRKLISKILEKIIDARFQVSISDTHGLKALKREKISGLLDKIKCPNHFFDSELILRLINQGESFIEIPVNLKELRSSRFSFLVRFREVINEFVQLMSIRLEKPKVVAAPYGLRFQKAVVNYITQLFF